MKTKFKRTFALLLTALTCFSAAACGDNGNGGNGGATSADTPTPPNKIVSTTETTVHKVEGTLHKVSVTDSNRVFVQNGATEYKIVAETDHASLGGAIKKSLDFITLHVNEATGALLTVADGVSTVTQNDKYIILGRSDLFAAAGLTMPEDHIGTTGYYIKTLGNLVFVQANGTQGYQLGGIALLRALVGYDMFSEDCVVYEKDGAMMPDMEIVEKPDLDYRQESNNLTATELYGMGIQGDTDIYPAIEGATIHNAFEYIPKAKYGINGTVAKHEKWYADDGNNPCFTAHGDEAEYEAFVQTIAGMMIDQIALTPDVENITFTQEDFPDLCKCSSCGVYRTQYGTIAATIIRFMNDVDDVVQAYIDENIPGKTLNLLFFAYHDSQPAPVEKSADGEYIPRDSYINEAGEEVAIEPIVCNDNVFPLLAPINAKYTHSFYEEINSGDAESLYQWSAVSKKLYLWLYSTNFGYYLYPYNTWDTMAETLRFLVENDVAYIYHQGQYNQEGTTGFTALKDYLDSKLQFDCNADYNACVDKFFKYYFAEGGDIMRKVFDEIQARYRYLEKENPLSLNGYIREEIAKKEYWPKGMLEGWWQDMKDALALVERYQTTDPKKYEALYKAITLETIFPRYALCTLYASEYNPTELLEMRKAFNQDCLKYNVTRHQEHVTIDSVFAGWGV